MIKNLKFIFFSSAIVFLSFSLMAMDKPSSAGTVTPFQRVNRGLMPIQDLQFNLGENEWLLYNKNTNNGVVVNIDLLVNCDDFTKEQMDKANTSFAESLNRRIESGQIVNFDEQNVANRTIPYDIPDDLLSLFVGILGWGKCSKEEISHEQVGLRNFVLKSIKDRLNKLSFDGLVKCINLFDDLGVSATGIRHRGHSVVNLKENLLINTIVKRINGDIASFLQVGETALSDILRTSINTLEEIQNQYQTQSEKLNTYKEGLDKLKEEDIERIKNAVTFSHYVASRHEDPTRYFNELIFSIEQNENIASEYLVWLKNIFNSYGELFKEVLSANELNNLMRLIEQYVGTMVDERRNRINNPGIWQATASSFTPEDVRARTEEFIARSREVEGPSILSQAMAAAEARSLKQKIWAMIAAGGVGAYLLYQYLTQKQQ